MEGKRSGCAFVSFVLVCVLVCIGGVAGGLIGCSGFVGAAATKCVSCLFKPFLPLPLLTIALHDALPFLLYWFDRAGLACYPDTTAGLG